MNPTQDTAAVKKPVYRRIRLQVNGVTAKEVIVTGEFTGWTREGVRLTQLTPGIWWTTLQLAPGEYQYRLIVDGAWRDHADAEKRVENPFGGKNCVLVVR